MLTEKCSTPQPHKSPKIVPEPIAATASLDRRRLSDDIGRLLEPTSMQQSASSSKVALVIAASSASCLLAAPKQSTPTSGKAMNGLMRVSIPPL